VTLPRKTLVAQVADAASATCNFVLAILGIAGTAALVLAFGWPLDSFWATALYEATNLILLYFGLCEIGLFFAARNYLNYARENILPLIAAFLALVASFGSGRIHDILLHAFGAQNLRIGLLGFIIISQVAVILPLALRWLRHGRRTWMTHVQPRTIVIGSFATLIICGALLLMTPNATRHGIHFIDALFTSTSAVCVTGLNTVDTEAVFTLHGQFVILVLIQAGGLGLMTFTFFLSMLAGEGISLHDRVMLREVMSERNVGFISRILLEIITWTAVIEGIGALLMYHILQGVALPPGGTAWHAIFHSVSAFCNAGFSTLSGNLADPRIVDFRSLQAVVMGLIILGGIGFPVLREIRQRGLSYLLPKFFERPSHMTLHTRLVVRMTLLLLVGGTLLIYICQFVGHGGPAPSLWRAAFDSVTARTAGFNIADVGQYSVSVSLVIIFLMFVGGSPAGTAGGVKTTTFALALLNLWTIVREKREIQVGWRTVSQRTANQAFAILVISLAWVGVAAFAMSVVEPTRYFLDLLFETVSAFGTVGLSRDLTPTLGPSAKSILIATMFIGRIGLIVLASALLHARQDIRYTLPKEDVSLT
jgi:potassium uptake TrkH family protein